MRPNDGGPAFPNPGEYLPDGTTCFSREEGMTLRDYFAAKAMQGLCGNSEWLSNASMNTGDALMTCAKAAYEMADAMLKVREVEA